VPITESIVDLALDVKRRLDEAKATIGLADVYYGDQTKIPRVPAACVEPIVKRREHQGVPRQTLVDFQVGILVYLAEANSVQTTREDVDRVAEAIETELHKDSQMGGLVIDSLVSTLESGYAFRGNTLYRTSRIVFTGRSKVGLPLS